VGDGRQTGKSQVKKATFESSKKKEIGVSDLTLLSKISNEAINDNLKLRFEHDEIYVRRPPTQPTAGQPLRAGSERRLTGVILDLYRTCAGLCQPVPGL
jgi:hypothetical protein